MRRRLLALVLVEVIAAMGCARRSPEIRKAPERETVRKEAPPPPPDSKVTTLVGHAGEVVAIEGRVIPAAKRPVTTSIPGKSMVVVEIEGSHLQVATYVTMLLDCQEVRVEGTVIVATGMARSGSTEGFYAEPQLDVDTIRCR